jgi:ribonuclease HII
MHGQRPTAIEETALSGMGYRLIAGLDEVGRGALAGDVVAAAVILPLDAGSVQRLHAVRDSKQLSARQRSTLAAVIQAEAIAIGLGRVSASDIDHLGIVPATRLAMMQAIASLTIAPDYLLIDALRLPAVYVPQTAIVHGDALCLSIAAASIVAKVYRDAEMVRLDAVYSGYGFARHKGYGTAAHLQALHMLRPCPIHRLSFAPVGAVAR